MKMTLILLSLFSLQAFAGPIQLKDHYWTLDDVAEMGHTKEELYSSMNLGLVRVKDSICSNRAQVWAHDFRKTYNIRTAKIFLFYTNNNHNDWWYHAANVINENGELHVLDAGYPYMFKGTRNVRDWYREFTNGSNDCREIKASERDLVEMMFNGEKFPVETRYGKHDCYYHIAPEGYWTPNHLAKGLLQQDESGRAISFMRSELVEDEVFEACMEVATTPLGWAWGRGSKKCAYFVEHGSN
jgi:hypothetical protein